MVANDDAYPLGNRGILETIASKLAPTGGGALRYLARLWHFAVGQALVDVGDHFRQIGDGVDHVMRA